MLNLKNLLVCPFRFSRTHTTGWWGGGRSKESSMQVDRHKEKWPKRRTGGRTSFKYQGHLKLRLSKPKLSFLHYPLSSSNYFENYSQANHKHFNGLCLDDMYVSCTCFHQNKQTNKQTKEKPKKFLST